MKSSKNPSSPIAQTVHSIACASGLIIAISIFGFSIHALLIKDRAVDSLSRWCVRTGSCAATVRRAGHIEFPVYSDRVIEAEVILANSIDSSYSPLFSSSFPKIISISRVTKSTSPRVKAASTNRNGSAR